MSCGCESELETQLAKKIKEKKQKGDDYVVYLRKIQGKIYPFVNKREYAETLTDIKILKV